VSTSPEPVSSTASSAEHFYRTVGEAVHAYVAAENVDWVDWEDRR
jgi:hypothetical protein